jgi:hypothetical protein
MAFASEKMTSKMEVISNTKITEFFDQDTIKKETKNVVYVVGDNEKTMTKEAKHYFTIVKDRTAAKDTCHKKVIRMIANIKDSLGGETFSVMFRDSIKEPLIIVNGKAIDLEIFKALKPEAVKDMEVFKDAKATKEYGEKGKNGVIVVSLKDPEKQTDNKIHLSYSYIQSGKQIDSNIHLNYSYAQPGKQIILNADTIRIDKDSKLMTIKGLPDVLYIVNGEIKENFNIESLEPNSIKTVNVYKGEKAVQKYGEKGKKGVIDITLKESTEK